MPHCRAVSCLSPRYARCRNTGDHWGTPGHNDLQLGRGFSTRFARQCWMVRSFESGADRTRLRTRPLRVCGFTSSIEPPASGDRPLRTEAGLPRPVLTQAGAGGSIDLDVERTIDPPLTPAGLPAGPPLSWVDGALSAAIELTGRG